MNLHLFFVVLIGASFVFGSPISSFSNCDEPTLHASNLIPNLNATDIQFDELSVTWNPTTNKFFLVYISETNSTLTTSITAHHVSATGVIEGTLLFDISNASFDSIKVAVNTKDQVYFVVYEAVTNVTQVRGTFIGFDLTLKRNVTLSENGEEPAILYDPKDNTYIFALELKESNTTPAFIRVYKLDSNATHIKHVDISSPTVAYDDPALTLMNSNASSYYIVFEQENASDDSKFEAILGATVTFNTTGVNVSQFDVYTNGTYHSPQVYYHEDNNFLVIWEEADAEGEEVETFYATGRLTNRTQFPPQKFHSKEPSVAYDTLSKTFVAVHETDSDLIQASHIYLDGSMFVVVNRSTDLSSGGDDPVTAFTSSGQLLVAWIQEPQHATKVGIFAALYCPRLYVPPVIPIFETTTAPTTASATNPTTTDGTHHDTSSTPTTTSTQTETTTEGTEDGEIKGPSGHRAGVAIGIAIALVVGGTILVAIIGCITKNNFKQSGRFELAERA